jgi:hypothetical protein
MQATGTQTLQRSVSPRRVLIAALAVAAIIAILGSYAVLRTNVSTPTRQSFPQVSVEPGHDQPATLIHEISMRPTNGN